MHEEKMHSALSALTNVEGIFDGKYQVIDWGCGQGLASLCLLDYLNEHKNLHNPKKIILIEPSIPSIVKANNYLAGNLDGNTNIVSIAKKLNFLLNSSRCSVFKFLLGLGDFSIWDLAFTILRKWRISSKHILHIWRTMKFDYFSIELVSIIFEIMHTLR